MPEVSVEVGSPIKTTTASAQKWMFRGLGKAASELEYRKNKESNPFAARRSQKRECVMIITDKAKASRGGGKRCWCYERR